LFSQILRTAGECHWHPTLTWGVGEIDIGCRQLNRVNICRGCRAGRFY